MSTEPPTIAADAFKSAGLNLEELAEQQRAMMAANKGAMPVNGERSRPVPSLKALHVCLRCGTATLPPNEVFCFECDKKGDAAIAPPAAPKARVVSIGDDFPRRHVESLATFHGPALEKAQKLLPRVLDGQILLLYGDPGRGKTGMATWWEWQRLLAGKSAGRFLTAQGFFSEIKATWHPKSDQTESALIQAFRKSRYTVIDEADERSESAWENRTLFDLLNHAYNDRRTLVLISNLSLEQLQKTWPAKQLDRINEAGGMVECAWQNYREAGV